MLHAATAPESGSNDSYDFPLGIRRFNGRRESLPEEQLSGKAKSVFITSGAGV
jgi:hypothetical protein